MITITHVMISKDLSVAKVYLSIFPDKNNVRKENYIPTVGVPSRMFFDLFKSYLDRIMDEYAVILRLNCEGVEDDVIYAAHEYFQEKLLLIMGSIEDVQECKGNSAYVNLEKYLKIRMS